MQSSHVYSWERIHTLFFLVGSTERNGYSTQRTPELYMKGKTKMTMTKGTPLFDYQEFCVLLDHIQTLKSLASQYKSEAAMYHKKILQICERVEADFCDTHHLFTNWVERKPVCLDSGEIISLNCDRKVIFVLLILNRRKELGLPLFKSDVAEFYKLSAKSNTNFLENYFTGE